MPRNPKYLLFVGIKHHVVALDRDTGEERWRTKLPAGMTTDFVTLHRDDAYLYAASGGEVLCLDPRTGDARWHNKLKGLGYGIVSLLSDAAARGAEAPSSAAGGERQRLRSAQAGGAT